MTRRTASTASFTAARGVILPVVATGVLVAVSGTDYLAFHTVAELFAVGVGLSLFFVAAPLSRGGISAEAALVGGGYFWVALLDLMHTLTYEGMDLYDGAGADMAAQLWLAGRLLEGLVLLSLPLRLGRPAHGHAAFFTFGLLALGAYFAIFEGVFPTTFVPGEGLTTFKIAGEYLIIALLIGALVLLHRRRDRMEPAILRLLTASILFTIGAELLFTTYTVLDGPINVAGHILKFWSYWFILRALLHRRVE